MHGDFKIKGNTTRHGKIHDLQRGYHAKKSTSQYKGTKLIKHPKSVLWEM